MAMKNIERAIEIFRGHNPGSHPTSIRATEEGIYSYDTCIATRSPGGKVIVNMSKYSKTTSTLQKALRAEFYPNVFLTDGLPRGITAAELRTQAIYDGLDE
jgi:hypothetical protein